MLKHVSRVLSLRKFPVGLRPLSYKLPIDLSTPKDDKYQELNNMYVEMFTEGSSTSAGNTHSTEDWQGSEIENLNRELNEICNIPVLAPSALQEKASESGRFIIRSLSTDPYFNLALEDFVFKKTPLALGSPPNALKSAFQSERLIFYTNRDCVVIGKNQNPWREVYLDNLKASGFEFIRRRSGGGAVVHDLGNINYSYLTSREKFDRVFFNERIVEWLKPYNSTIALNERSDITLAGKKISGSAFKIARGKSYHHGTMLISSQLQKFSNLLKPNSVPGVDWKCASVPSVRSHVDNLMGNGIDTADQFCDIVATGFRKLMNENIPLYYCDESSATPEITNTMNELNSPEWKYMGGPKFTVFLADREFKVENGYIVESSLQQTVGQSFQDFVVALNNGEYSELCGVKL
ncbi:HBR412Wp [Eremothecium sinecaudum]|uniref:Putative lipoate-protein ligase A n=1 Tax=Eremothecium sinecaudum TaxID=45286 RepID=A0A109UXK4_9SACH|nr:HBR412Wp [Eremothecium sinecaudum]AMD19313.1 HBR412Wp [Eremothecium sinecaudum]